MCFPQLPLKRPCSISSSLPAVSPIGVGALCILTTGTPSRQPYELVWYLFSVARQRFGSRPSLLWLVGLFGITIMRLFLKKIMALSHWLLGRFTSKRTLLVHRVKLSVWNYNLIFIDISPFLKHLGMRSCIHNPFPKKNVYTPPPHISYKMKKNWYGPPLLTLVKKTINDVKHID